MMTPSAAALAGRYGELNTPIIIMAGTDDRIVNFASQSEHLEEVLREATLVPFEGAGHMIHHVDPEKVVEGINLIGNRSSRMPEGQSFPP